MTCTPFRKDEKKNEKKNEKILIFGGKLWYVLARRVTDRRKHDQGGKGGEISSSFPDRGSPPGQNSPAAGWRRHGPQSGEEHR